MGKSQSRSRHHHYCVLFSHLHHPLLCHALYQLPCQDAYAYEGLGPDFETTGPWVPPSVPRALAYRESEVFMGGRGRCWGWVDAAGWHWAIVSWLVGRCATCCQRSRSCTPVLLFTTTALPSLPMPLPHLHHRPCLRPCCSFRDDDFAQLGVGVALYFRTLRSLALVFGMLAVLALPSWCFYAAGSRMTGSIPDPMKMAR